MNDLHFVQHEALVQILPSPMKAVADSTPKHLLFSPMQCHQILEGGSSWSYMCTLNNSSKVWLVLTNL